MEFKAKGNSYILAYLCYYKFVRLCLYVFTRERNGKIMADTTELINVFEDTSKWYSTDLKLKGYVKKSISGTKFYSA